MTKPELLDAFSSTASEHEMTYGQPEEASGFILVSDDFPVEDLRQLRAQLVDAEFLIPSCVLPDDGLLSIEGLLYERSHGFKTILLPDRNVVSRMAQLADGRTVKDDEQLGLAASLLAFCQCFDIYVEPSIAFHELAHREGNERAWEELAQFRLADSAHALETIDVALGRKPVLQLRGISDSEAATSGDLAKPLRRWNRNYVIALKILELEDKRLAPRDRVLELMDWMVSDFMFGASAALMAMLYLAPNSSPKKRMFKGRNSRDREKAIAGVRNAAWDLTHVSDCITKVNGQGFDESTRFILASFDRQLLTIARIILEHGSELSPPEGLQDALSNWWPELDAKRLVEAFRAHLATVHAPGWRRSVVLDTARIEEFIAKGEAHVLATPC